MRNIFVTGIGTGVGKTVVSAVLVEALKADYWKPVQTGMEFGTDSERVTKLISNEQSVFHPERYCFKAPERDQSSRYCSNVIIVLQRYGNVPMAL